ncbi:hypothetical protein CLOM_g5300 [Closterium sp. NIES-68]|nr:hypothetical protein CLOM_g5300 [Closterium sp. NIES-68]
MLQRFLGFVNYVQKFIPNMAGVTAPLTNMLRKVIEYRWGEKEQAAFSALKTLKCSAPIPHIADPHRPFKVIRRQRHRHRSSTITGVRRSTATNRVRVTKAAPAQEKLSDTRPGDARDRARLQCVAVLLVGHGRNSTDRPPKPTIHLRTATTQPMTHSVVGFHGVQLALYGHLQKRGIEYCRPPFLPICPSQFHHPRPNLPAINKPIYPPT